MCDEIICTEAKSNNEETKLFPTNFNEKKKVVYKTKKFISYLNFY